MERQPPIPLTCPERLRSSTEQHRRLLLRLIRSLRAEQQSKTTSERTKRMMMTTSEHTLHDPLEATMGSKPDGRTAKGWPYWTTDRGNRILGPWPEYDWSGLR